MVFRWFKNSEDFRIRSRVRERHKCLHLLVSDIKLIKNVYRNGVYPHRDLSYNKGKSTKTWNVFNIV